jgi:hypothetical protein
VHEILREEVVKPDRSKIGRRHESLVVMLTAATPARSIGLVAAERSKSFPAFPLLQPTWVMVH